MKITILGNGSWGTAVGTLLTQNNHEFNFFQPGEKIKSDSILIVCIPTQVIRKVLKEAVVENSKLIFINGAKGIELNTHKFPHDIAMDVLGRDLDYFSLIGPSFAAEVKNKMPTLVNLGYVNEENAPTVRDLFQTDYFRVKLTKGVKALELASAFKNIYAIACGIADGLGFETNTRVKLIMIAIQELNKLSKALAFQSDENALPGTVGDLILTCNSNESRNFSFGKLLTQHTVEKSLELVGETVEGFHTVESVPYFENETGIKLSLAKFVYEVISDDNPKTIRSRFKEFVKHA